MTPPRPWPSLCPDRADPDLALRQAMLARADEPAALTEPSVLEHFQRHQQQITMRIQMEATYEQSLNNPSRYEKRLAHGPLLPRKLLSTHPVTKRSGAANGGAVHSSVHGGGPTAAEHSIAPPAGRLRGGVHGGNRARSRRYNPADTIEAASYTRPAVDQILLPQIL